jgi:hypothetical protein
MPPPRAHCMTAGQTTALGEVKPSSKGQQGQGDEQSGSSGSSSSGGASGESAQAAHDPRAEPPLPDKTGQYAAIGAVTGIFLGWASQFF